MIELTIEQGDDQGSSGLWGGEPPGHRTARKSLIGYIWSHWQFELPNVEPSAFHPLSILKH